MKDNVSPIDGPARGGNSLPAKRSFVIQFTEASDCDQRGFTGRIEHVLSGDFTSFTGGPALLDALEAALSDVSHGGHAAHRPAGHFSD